MARRGAFTTLEEDTPILPGVVAEAVTEEAAQLLGYNALPDREAFVRGLVDEQARLYQANPEWRRKMRAAGNKGRDTLYVFMRHWLTSDVKRRLGRAAADKLGRDFANGVFVEPPKEERTPWSAGNDGTGPRKWRVFRDVRWTAGGLARKRRETSEDAKGRVRKFASRAAAERHAAELNAPKVADEYGDAHGFFVDGVLAGAYASLASADCLVHAWARQQLTIPGARRPREPDEPLCLRVKRGEHGGDSRPVGELLGTIPTGAFAKPCPICAHLVRRLLEKP